MLKEQRIEGEFLNSAVNKVIIAFSKSKQE
jgi:hypothetical protein